MTDELPAQKTIYVNFSDIVKVGKLDTGAEVIPFTKALFLVLLFHSCSCSFAFE